MDKLNLVDTNFKTLTNVKQSNLRPPAIQNRFRKLTLTSTNNLKPSTSTKLPKFSQPKKFDEKIICPTVQSEKISQVNVSESSLENELMSSSSSKNTNEEQTVNIETEPFTERLQLSDTEQSNLPNVDNYDLATDMITLGVSQRRVSPDMFSQGTSESSEFYLPPNRVLFNKDESIDSISQRITDLNMADTHNESLADTQPNTPAQVDAEKSNQGQSSAIDCENVHSSSLFTSDDSDSYDPAHLFNVSSAKKSPARTLSTPKTSAHKSSERKSKTGPDNEALSNAGPISLSSDSEDNYNVSDSVTTDETSDDGSDVIDILSSDNEAEENYEKNFNLTKDNEINSNKASEFISDIKESETNATNDDIDLDNSISDNCENPVPEQTTPQKENNKSGISHSPSCLYESDESAVKRNKPHNDSVLKTIESQLSSLTIESPKIKISARIRINIQLPSSSSDTDSSSDIDFSQQKLATQDNESKKLTVVERSFEHNADEDQFRKIDTDTHTTGSHSRIDSSELKNHQIDDTRSEISQSDSSVIESSLLGSSLLANDDSMSSRPNPGRKLTHKSINNSSKDKSYVTSAKKLPATKSYTPKPTDNDSVDDNRPEITEVGQKILNELYGDDWKTPQMIKKCQPVRSNYFTVIPKLNNNNDFSLFEREVSKDLESTRIATVPSNIQIDNTQMEESQITSNHATISKSTGCSGQLNSINNVHEDSSRILRSGRKVAANRILEFSSDEDKLSENDDNYSDNSFKPKLSDEDLSDDSCESEVKTTSKPKPTPIIKSTTKTPRKKKSELVYLDLTHHEVIEDEEHIDPDASSEDLEAISNMFLMSLEFKKAVETPMPKKELTSLIRTKRKLFTPNYDNETPFEDNKTPCNTPTNIVCKTVKLKAPIPTYLIPPQFRELSRINEIADETTPTPKTTPISVPKSINKKQIPNTPLSASGKICGFLESLNANLIPDRYCDPVALRLRSNFKQYRNELTDRLSKIYNDQVFENKLGDIVVKWNKTLRKTAGLCKYRRRGGNRNFTVELSEKVLTGSDRLRDTFIHELCHAAAWIFDGEMGHGLSWKKWTRKAMERLPELPEIKACHNYSIDYKYTYKCTICGSKSQAHSKSKKIENIRCASCHGAIEVYFNKKDKDGKITLVPPEGASGFSKFVKENYKLHKVPGSVHTNVMKLLGSEFSKLTVQEKLKYK